MIILLIVIIVAIMIAVMVHKSNQNPKDVLTQYGLAPEHPRFKRVVIMIDGCEGDLDKTINSVLNQSVRVSEISTGVEKDKCNISKMCASVLNHYDDPYEKGAVKSTFERELEADTIVVFVKRGHVFERKDSLDEYLSRWTPQTPVKTANVSVLSSNQC